jgi:phage repressor protein C with HTH and peptisase S24 domain
MKTFLQSIYDELIFRDKVKSQSDFGEKLDYKSEGYISALLKSDKDIPPKMQKKLNEVFNISKTYMLSNGKEGSLFQDAKNDQEVSKRRIPFIGEGLAGTDMELNVSDAPPENDYIDVGDLLKDSEAAFIVYGNSMTPAYPPGCVLGIRRNLDKFIQPGETYLLLTKSNRVFKRLYYNDDKSGYVCISDNHLKHDSGPYEGKFFYPPFEVHGDDVISVFDITGMIKRNRNSGIMGRQK